MTAFGSLRKHVDDVTKVAQYLIQKGHKALTLAGMSRGTLSAAHLALNMNALYVKNVILASHSF